MTSANIYHTLTWVMQLQTHGHVCYRLEDERGLRWAWIINTPAGSWTAHLGDFGEAAAVAHTPPPLVNQAQFFVTIEEAQQWVESGIVSTWSWTRSSPPSA